MRLAHTLMKRNEDQRKEINLLNMKADIEEQVEIMQREIKKQKQMYKMLMNHKKEEDQMFKDKFVKLVEVEELRAKLKEQLFNARAGTEPREEGSSTERGIKTGTMKRGRS